MRGRRGIVVGIAVFVAGCAALTIALRDMDSKQQPTAASEAGRDRSLAGRSSGPPPLPSLPLPNTPVEGIDPDSLQRINPVYTVPRGSRLHGREGKRWAQQNLIGLTFAQADELAAQRGMSVRIIEIDGKPMPLHRDLARMRINVALAGPQIVRIDGMY